MKGSALRWVGVTSRSFSILQAIGEGCGTKRPEARAGRRAWWGAHASFQPSPFSETRHLLRWGGLLKESAIFNCRK